MTVALIMLQVSLRMLVISPEITALKITSLSVGRFCMNLLHSLIGWPASEAARATLRSPALTTAPRVCYFGEFPCAPERLRVWGEDVPPNTLWYPDPPLWTVGVVEDRSET